jgi:hypothetical protein
MRGTSHKSAGLTRLSTLSGASKSPFWETVRRLANIAKAQNRAYRSWEEWDEFFAAAEASGNTFYPAIAIAIQSQRERVEVARANGASPWQFHEAESRLRQSWDAEIEAREERDRLKLKRENDTSARHKFDALKAEEVIKIRAREAAKQEVYGTSAGPRARVSARRGQQAEADL